MTGAMVRIQYLTGMRPGELCAMRPCDLDRSQPEWKYVVRVENAKVGVETYWLGPRAQKALSEWLTGVPDGAPIFHITAGTYRRHIGEHCAAAGVKPWAPHQLRHSHGTNVTNLFGQEGAMAALNHSELKTSRRYSRTSSALARRIAGEMG